MAGDPSAREVNAPFVVDDREVKKDLRKSRAYVEGNSDA